VTVVSVGGGFAYGYLGYTHHAIEDVAVMRALPGMTVLTPADPAEARLLTRAAVEAGGPHYLRLGKNGEARLHETEPTVSELRGGSTLREGADVAILASGPIAAKALEAAARLHDQGVSAKVVSVPIVKPIGFDPATLVGNGAGIVTVEEHTLHGGLASAVLEAAALSGSTVRVAPVYAKEEMAGRIIGSQTYIQDRAGLSVDDIISAALRLLPADARQA
jgi:transketolase